MANLKPKTEVEACCQIMILYNSAGILYIANLFLVVVSRYGYDGHGYIESRLLNSNIFYENAAAMKVDFGSCAAAASAEEICQTADFMLQETDHPVHVCLKDGKIIIIILNRCTRFLFSSILHCTCVHECNLIIMQACMCINIIYLQ